MQKNLRKSQLQEQSQSFNNQSNITESRINLIEQNLQRICLQQDALMPLLQMIDMIPQLAKTENNLKIISKRIEEQENKNLKNEKLIVKALQDVTNQNNNTTKGSVESKLNNKFDGIQRQFKDIEDKLNHNFDVIQRQFKDMEDCLNNQFKSYEAKIKEETSQLQRNIDKKSESNKKYIQESQKKETQKNDLQKFKEEVQAYAYVDKEIMRKCEEKINNQLKDLKQSIDNEIRYIYKEIGGLKCEIDFIIYENRQKKLKKTQNIQAIKQDKQLYNYLDYDIFLNDLEQFNNQNSAKLLSEIDLLKKELVQNKNIQTNDINFLMERKVNLQYQIQGRKKKIAVDLKIIENQNQIFQQSDNFSTEYQQQIKNLDQRTENLLVNVYNNIDKCHKEILKIGDLINQRIIQQNRLDDNNHEPE